MPVPSPFAAALAAVPVREAQLDVQGSETHYWEYGPTDRPVDLVLVHGYRGDHHGLEPMVTSLGGLRIVAPDMPGFGASTALPERHTVDAYSRWLVSFMEALGLVGTPILGHSFGSIVVAQAVSDGLEARRLVFVNPIAENATSGPDRIFLPLVKLYFWIGELLSDRLAHVWLGMPLATQIVSSRLAVTRDRRLRRWIHEEHRRYFAGFSDARTLAEAYDASISTYVREVADRLTMPTLLVVGDRDGIVPLAAQRRLAADLADAQLVVLVGVGHLIHYERPAEAAGQIRRFLDER